jgi:hypothetical protein
MNSRALMGNDKSSKRVGYKKFKKHKDSYISENTLLKSYRNQKYINGIINKTS